MAVSDSVISKPDLDMLRIDIVRGCQLQCVGCPNSSIRLKVKDMPVDLFASIMENFDGTANRLCLYNYGEPLLHRDLPGIFEVLKKHSHKFRTVEISTNGQFVRWDEFEEVLKTGLIGRLFLSCDGDGTPESFERMRPPAKWEKLVEFAAKTSELRKKHDLDLQLSSRTVLMEAAHGEKWNELFHPLGWKTQFISWLRLVGATENLSDKPAKPGIGVCHFLKGWAKTMVSWDGSVIPCCAHPNAGNFGNMATQKWSSVFAGKPRNDFIEALDNDRTSLSICSQCEFGSDFAFDPLL